MVKQYETIIGLEVHVELSTKTKIFCSCSTKFGAEPNSHTCAVCTGMPGTLPVLNKQVVEYAVALGLATECEISPKCKFDRKNYFYPDNPQNYQISQLYVPICKNGKIKIETVNGNKDIRIHEIHMEEDAGKLIHNDLGDYSLIDYNRAGIPLLEIVSAPDMTDEDEVVAYLEKLKSIIQYLNISDCKLNEGSMRVDVNLSVRKVGENKLGTRTETKNLNSFRAIKRAISNERVRQIKILEAGNEIEFETRRWDDNTESSYSMRSKEGTKDYRYFPEPDLVRIVIDNKWISEIKKRCPEMREDKIIRYEKEFDIPMYDIMILTGDKYMADIFEHTVSLYNNPKKISNWLMTETMYLLKEMGMEPKDIKFSPANLAKLIELTDLNVINSNIAKEVFYKIFTDDIDPEKYIKEKALMTINSEDKLKIIVENVIGNNPKPIKDYKSGKKKAIDFLVGQVMKELEGKANPDIVRGILEELLQ